MPATFLQSRYRQQTTTILWSRSSPPFPPSRRMHRLILQSWPLRRLPFPDVISMSNSPSLSIVSRPVSDTQLLGDVSTGIFRPLVPAPFREHIIRSLHSVHHPGIRATARLVKASFCWPKMEKDITAVARSCMGCQLGKVQRHVTLEPEHIPVPHRRFLHVHVDLVGPLPKSAGFNHLFTVMDRTTRWPEAIPLSSTAADCAAALFTGWIQRF
jgi:cleavage and polyadenylation specificity factor subunit 1